MNKLKFVLSTIMMVACISANATTINDLVGKYALTNQQIISGQNNVGPNAGCADKIEIEYNPLNTFVVVTEFTQGLSLFYNGYLNGQIYKYKTNSNLVTSSYSITAKMENSALVINQVRTAPLMIPETTLMTVKKVNSKTTTVNYKVMTGVFGFHKTKYELLCTYAK